LVTGENVALGQSYLHDLCLKPALKCLEHLLTRAKHVKPDQAFEKMITLKTKSNCVSLPGKSPLFPLLRHSIYNISNILNFFIAHKDFGAPFTQYMLDNFAEFPPLVRKIVFPPWF
jgi:hypothetical protein